MILFMHTIIEDAFIERFNMISARYR